MLLCACYNQELQRSDFHSPCPILLFLHPSILDPSNKLKFAIHYLSIFSFAMKTSETQSGALLHLELVFREPGRRGVQPDHLSAEPLFAPWCSFILLGLSQMTSLWPCWAGGSAGLIASQIHHLHAYFEVRGENISVASIRS